MKELDKELKREKTNDHLRVVLAVVIILRNFKRIKGYLPSRTLSSILCCRDKIENFPFGRDPR